LPWGDGGRFPINVKNGEFGVFGGVYTQIFRIKFGLFEQNDKKMDFSCCT
jgi:hypothetical protein